MNATLAAKPEPKGVINLPIPAKNATVDEPVKLQVTEEVHHQKKSHKHKAAKHHSHHKSHLSKKDLTELQILNDRDTLFNDEV